MKRRDFMKSTLGTALGAGLSAVPMALAASSRPTMIESEDLNSRASLKDEYDLHFVAIGDWGRNGADHQVQVAQQMGKWTANHPNDFIISTGDNFYPSGVISEHDPLWHYSFENVYTDFSLQWDWYPILGNHDYKSDPDAQVRYSAISRRWKMPARYYSKTFKLREQGEVLMAFIDTNPLIPEFYKNSEYGPHVAGQQPEKQLAWLDKLLTDSSAQWKIVVGHHPIYTAGPRTENYDTLAVRKVLEPILQKHEIPVYLSGHEHSMQHLKVSDKSFQQFISGSGSEVTPVKKGLAYSRFEASSYGFMYFAINKTQLSVQCIDHEGSVVYQTIVPKK
ncbi:purple acid phosphatase family protein [Sphingobacterium bambusae]|uniref:acid phosphatase n=1 Tax=Sphingobacterium bambusae TaxID=662858 RepID=A0ABW6BCA5_9SPHI|nr:tartrate-resistant acid phosphatase type 5 family protein [Sphingobacterium bambusae]WPL48301.1 tartrate-resistant acid phosphatase type 5 family protein [Sphingobacterium bambusae]